MKPTASFNPDDAEVQSTTTPSASDPTVELPRRPRGRPPGSKNKPKPPVLITHPSPTSSSALRPHVLEVSAGADVADALLRFSRRRNLGLSVLAATGAVLNLTLRQPSSSSAVTFHGRFELLSLSATFLPPECAVPVGGVPVSVAVAGAQGQVVGGSVVGALTAAGVVTVVAAAFEKPSFHRIPEEEREREREGEEGAVVGRGFQLPGDAVWTPPPY